MDGLWGPWRPVKELPEGLVPYFVEAAGYLLGDLLENHHKVVLKSAPDPHHSGHKIRMLKKSSPTWYQELLSFYTASWSVKHERKVLPSHLRRRRFVPGIERVIELRDGPYNPYNQVNGVAFWDPSSTIRGFDALPPIGARGFNATLARAIATHMLLHGSYPCSSREMPMLPNDEVRAYFGHGPLETEALAGMLGETSSDKPLEDTVSTTLDKNTYDSEPPF